MRGFRRENQLEEKQQHLLAEGVLNKRVGTAAALPLGRCPS